MLGAAIAGAALSATAAWRRLGRRAAVGRDRGAADLRTVAAGRCADPAAGAALPARGPRASGAPIAGIIVLGGAEDSRAEGCAAAGRRSTRRPSATPRPSPWRGACRRCGWCSRGGSGTLLRKRSRPRPRAAGRLFAALGIAEERIVLEAQSRDTYENAVFTARLLDPEARRALAAGDVGLAHAARDRMLPARGLRGGGLAGGLSRAAAGAASCASTIRSPMACAGSIS